jgi:hypothetical protein
MKRWWYTPRDSAWVRKNVRRVRPVLAGAVMAGALCFPIPGEASQCPGGMCISLPRTGGAVIAAWAFGTLSDAKQPESEACDLAHVCSLVISSNGGAGTGTGVTIKNDPATSTQADPPPNLPFTLTETIDYRHPVIKERDNAGQGACYPANGVMTITADASDTLVLDIVGQACQVGASPNLILTGSYFSDTASTGQFAETDGIGSVNINNPSGLEGAWKNMKASFLGQLKYTP